MKAVIVLFICFCLKPLRAVVSKLIFNLMFLWLRCLSPDTMCRGEFEAPVKNRFAVARWGGRHTAGDRPPEVWRTSFFFVQYFFLDEQKEILGANC